VEPQFQHLGLIVDARLTSTRAAWKNRHMPVEKARHLEKERALPKQRANSITIDLRPVFFRTL
jgi:hypothetical protein